DNYQQYIAQHPFLDASSDQAYEEALTQLKQLPDVLSAIRSRSMADLNVLHILVGVIYLVAGVLLLRESSYVLVLMVAAIIGCLVFTVCVYRHMYGYVDFVHIMATDNFKMQFILGFFNGIYTQQADLAKDQAAVQLETCLVIVTIIYLTVPVIFLW